ncbi:hypothetical protein SAMN05444920_103199 [Nonomuraea solani]|uniref:Uncharacterized protein n=1 Tax=Nonomuraea solani TaxID=1144553 RepID=A0A1H6B6S3_9ACTN|nr:hypothetical protein [Nonomuraea solani]SEG56541.1 hypothetical protein SAMN05444920_103199 [Nonomuraea solani]
MADHDRDDGSRGEEEAPRDPTQELHEPGLKYGEQADQPYARIPPTTPLPADSGHDSTFRDFLHRRRTQVTTAGVLGLVIGAMLGGTVVAAFDGLGDRHERHGMWMEHRHGGPELGEPACYRTEDGAYCAPGMHVLVPAPDEPVQAPEAPVQEDEPTPE